MEVLIYSFIVVLCFLSYIFFDKIKNKLFEKRKEKHTIKILNEEIEIISKRKRYGSPRKT
jgi:regulatory protein YycI of two-component signal transduction system YycFG